MTHTMDIPVEPLTTERFAPFGQVLCAKDSPPDFERPLLANWRLPFDSDAQLRLQVMRYGHQPMRLSRFERHIRVTEARVPINKAKGVLVVAEGGDAPEADAVRAFFLDGAAGIMFFKGVWHGLDCFPLAPPFCDFLMLSDSATEDEIEALDDNPVTGVRTQIYDFDPAQGMSFRIVDPDHLLTRTETQP